MSRNKVFEKARVTAPSGRNPFDLSQAIACTSLAGELNVVMAQPVIAGTKGKISRRCFTRTADVVSPAFHRVTEHFDFFLVPIHSLWRAWNDWKPNINDMKDTNLVPWDSTNNVPDLSLPVNVPRLDFLNLIVNANFRPSSGTPTTQNACVSNDVLKLCESMGYGECPAFAANGSLSARVMNVFKAGAYQKVYFEHYRNTAYESNNPYAYNFDWLYPSSGGLLDPVNDVKHRRIVHELFKMRRVNYRNDYFHNIYPALNYVSSNPSGLSGFSVPSDIGGFAASSVQNELVTGNSPNGGQVYVAAAQNSNNRAIVSVQAMRAAFALDKLMRASAYAPKHVREQWKVQFGVDTVDDPDMRSVRIGSFQSDITFQEVTNMADGLSPLGALGAKGVGSESKDRFINFFAKEDSIIIGVHYYLPRAMYDAYGLDPFNIHIERSQFFNKFFENLGLRPFYLHYVDGTGYRISSAGANTAIVLGWSVPNFEKKCQPDLNFGAFKQEFCDFRFVPASGSTPAYIQAITNATSKLSTFVPHNNAIDAIKAAGGNTITAEYFKVAPEDLDNIFLNATPADHRTSYFQFYGAYRIAYVIVAGMSVHGQPSL